MKLAFITNARLPGRIPTSFTIVQICEAFKESGDDVELICPVVLGEDKNIKVDIWHFYGLQTYFKIKRIFLLDLATVDRIRNFFGRYIANILQAIVYSYSLKLYLLFSDIDVFYCMHPITMFSLAFVGWHKKRKIYYESHEFPVGKIFRSIHRWSLNMAKGIIVINVELKRLYVRLGIPENKIIVIPNGVKQKRLKIINKMSQCEARTKLNLPLNRKIIVYTGNLYGWKGVETLVDSIRYLPDCLLCIVGGEEKDIMRFRNNAENGNNNIVFAGYAIPADVQFYCLAADVLVLPNTAKDEKSKYYTSPNKMFEYMASKRPIVASRLPSLMEVLSDGDNSVLVDPDSPEALALGIDSVLKNKRLSDKISSKAYKDVEKYTWTARVGKIKEFMKA